MGLCYNDRNSFNRFNISRNKGDWIMEFLMFIFNVVAAVLVGSYLFSLIERMFSND